jgi:hypothetical protein
MGYQEGLFSLEYTDILCTCITYDSVLRGLLYIYVNDSTYLYHRFVQRALLIRAALAAAHFTIYFQPHN